MLRSGPGPLQPSWFSEFAEGVGAAQPLAPELKFALMLATADRASEQGALPQGEIDRVRETRKRVERARIAAETAKRENEKRERKENGAKYPARRSASRS